MPFPILERLFKQIFRKPVVNGNIPETFRNTSLASTPYFQKLSIKRTDQLFKLLASEFDQESEFYWCDNYIEDQIDLVFQRYAQAEEPQDFSTWFEDPLVNPTMDKFLNRLTQFRYDPFIPKALIQEIYSAYERRFCIYHEVLNQKLEKLGKNLAGGKISIGCKGVLYNEINDELYNKGVGIAQIEELLL